MVSDPWRRPTLEDVRYAGEISDHNMATAHPSSEQFPCCIPAELITERGNSVSAMTQLIGPRVVTLIHWGLVPLGMARLRLAHDRTELVYLGLIEQSIPCGRGLFRTDFAIECETGE